MAKKMELTPEQKEFFSRMGKKGGGRPRTVAHKEEGFCRCAECRGKRKDTGYVEKDSKEERVDADFDFGA